MADGCRKIRTPRKIQSLDRPAWHPTQDSVAIAGIWIHTVHCGWGGMKLKDPKPPMARVLSLMMCPSASVDVYNNLLFANYQPSSFRLSTIWGLSGVMQYTWSRACDQHVGSRTNKQFWGSIVILLLTQWHPTLIAVLTQTVSLRWPTSCCPANHLNTLVSDEEKKVTVTLVQTNSVQTNDMTHYHTYSYMKPITNVAVTT